jgi:methylmalonyl-CoA mutase C-terminal domain/subunit
MKKIRVLMAKSGLDGHDRGVKVVARALRDAGMEVIYTGLKQTPDQIVEDAIEEDVDVIGLSILSGAHISIIEKVSELLKEEGASDIALLVGGIIPQEDISLLKDMGVSEVFGPGTKTEKIVTFIKEIIR